MIYETKLVEDGDKQRLVNELDLGLRFNHPNVNRVLDYDQADGVFYVFLEMYSHSPRLAFIAS